MKLTLVLFIGLILAVHASKSRFSVAVENNEQLRREVLELKTHPNTRIIIGMAEILTAGKTVKKATYGELWRAIFKLENYLKGVFKKDTIYLAEDKGIYLTKKAVQEYKAKQAEKTKKNAEMKLKKLDMEVKKWQERVAFLKHLKESAEELLEQLRKTEKEQIAEYKAQMLKYARAIRAITQSLEILESMQNSKIFLEMDQNNYDNLLEDLRASFVEVNDTPVLLHSLVQSTVLSFKKNRYVNQNLLQNIIQLLIAFKKRLIAGQGNDEANRKIEHANFLKNEKHTIKTIQGLDIKIKAGEQKIDQLNRDIAYQSKRKARAIRRLKAAVQAIAILNKNWLIRLNYHKKLARVISKDLALIAKTKKTLIKGGVKMSAY